MTNPAYCPFEGRVFAYGGSDWKIINYSARRVDYYARKIGAAYTTDVFSAAFVEGLISCPLEVVLIHGR
jgi:hypothetical protein